jgi:MoxR-like ATPase
MLKVLVGYPSSDEEFVVVERMTTALEETHQVVGPSELVALQRAADAVYVDPAVIRYAVQLAGATRRPEGVGLPDLARYISFGASPRASINLILAAKALAFLRGRDYALPVDARDLARDVLRHRIVLSYEGLAEGLAADDLLTPVLDAVPLPTVALRRDDQPTGGIPWTAPSP